MKKITEQVIRIKAEGREEIIEVRKELERLNAALKETIALAAQIRKARGITKDRKQMIKTVNENFKNQNEKKILITLIED